MEGYPIVFVVRNHHIMLMFHIAERLRLVGLAGFGYGTSEYGQGRGASGDSKVYFPHEVVHSHAVEEKSLVRSWREYKGLSQEEMAKRMGISQPAYAQMEKPSARLRLNTRIRIASALGIIPEQLTLN